MAKKKTGKNIAKLAAKGMRAPEKLTLDEIQSICASCLTQYEKMRELAKLLKDTETV